MFQEEIDGFGIGAADRRRDLVRGLRRAAERAEHLALERENRRRGLLPRLDAGWW
jgi:hypothetical protein